MTLDPSSLASQPLRTTVRVVAVSGEDDLARRLGDLGFWPGTEVELVRRAPLGDPLEVRLRGYRLALRRAEADRIQVAADGVDG